MLVSLIVAVAGFYTVGTDESGVSALVRPDGSPMYLSGVEHLRRQETHEFANTNWEACNIRCDITKVVHLPSVGFIKRKRCNAAVL